MGFFSRTKKIVKPLVDVPTWISYRQMADTSKGMFTFVKNLLVPNPKPATEETFEQAIQRLNLTEADLAARAKRFKQLTIFWIVIFFTIFFYSIYLAWQGSLPGFIASIGLSVFTLVQCFRNHFWLFQIKQRKLGCSLSEWFNGSF